MAKAWAKGSGPGLEAGAWQLLAGDWWLEVGLWVNPVAIGTWLLGCLAGCWRLLAGALDENSGIGLEARGWKLLAGGSGSVLAARGLRVFRYLVDWLVGWLVGLLVDCLIGQCS